MLSPPHVGAFDVGEAEQEAYHIYEGDQPSRVASEGFLGSIPSPPLKTNSRARSLCTWKDCQYRGRNADETK